MSPGTQVQENQGACARVVLNQERFDLITGTLGARTELARANLLSVDPKTVYRARRGIIGEEFIARALYVMQQHSDELRTVGIMPTFEAMFDLGEKRAAA